MITLIITTFMFQIRPEPILPLPGLPLPLVEEPDVEMPIPIRAQVIHNPLEVIYEVGRGRCQWWRCTTGQCHLYIHLLLVISYSYLFQIVPNGTIRGGDLLVTNVGHHYTRKVDNRPGRKQRWRCMTFNKGCKATVTEDMGTYIPGPQQHNCVPQPSKNTYITYIAWILYTWCV